MAGGGGVGVSDGGHGGPGTGGDQGLIHHHAAGGREEKICVLRKNFGPKLLSFF